MMYVIKPILAFLIAYLIMALGMSFIQLEILFDITEWDKDERVFYLAVSLILSAYLITDHYMEMNQ